MEVTKDIENVLMKISNSCYAKGMSKISTTVKGIRKDKIAVVPRNSVIPKLLKSGSNEKFLNEFIENISEDLEKLKEQDCIKKLIENPNTYNIVINCEDSALLYILLLSLDNNEKYKKVMRFIVNCLRMDDEVRSRDENDDLINQETRVKELEKICGKHEDEIKKWKELSKQRKEKIKELELNIKIKDEENQKIASENKKIASENEELKLQLKKNNESIDDTKNREEKDISMPQKIVYSKVAIVGISSLTMNIQNVKCSFIPEKTIIDEYEKCNSEYKKILVCKEKLHISKMRKIKNKYAEKAEFFENRESLEKSLVHMEEKLCELNQ